MIPQWVSTLFFELADFWRHLREDVEASGSVVGTDAAWMQATGTSAARMTVVSRDEALMSVAGTDAKG